MPDADVPAADTPAADTAAPDSAVESGSTPLAPELDPAVERQLAIDLFNRVWEFLGRGDRTPDDDDAMLHAAHASRWHWGVVGGAEQRAVGEWLCSRVYAALGRGEPAVHHARRCLEIVEARPGLPAWLAASAHEGLARASAVAGDLTAARAERDVAASLTAALDDPEDRAVVEGDLATLPAF